MKPNSDVNVRKGECAAPGSGHDHAHRSVTALMLLIGLVLIWLSLRLGIGAIRSPGPGLFPFLVSGMICLSAVVLMFRSGEPGEYEAMGRRTKVVVYCFLSLIAYVLAFAYFGFIVPSVIILFVWLRFVAQESWKITIILSLTIPGVLYILFVNLLSVPFPAGPFERLLGW